MAGFERKFESASVEWPTPQDLFDPVDAEFGFTLDVCATSENAKCLHYFTVEDDGLEQPWSGVCWMNPPYGRVMTEWLKKAVRETWNGVTTVALVPARTNTAWWHDICMTYGEVRFVRGRPKFGGAAHGLPQPLALIVFRGRPAL
jgi:phage N-6-adenine-methyltransferase